MSPLLIRDFVQHAIDSVAAEAEVEVEVELKKHKSIKSTKSQRNSQNSEVSKRNCELSKRIPMSMWEEVVECFSK